MGWLADMKNWEFDARTMGYRLRFVPAERFEALREAIARAALNYSIEQLGAAIAQQRGSGEGGVV
jgi:hypothetical protein